MLQFTLVKHGHLLRIGLGATKGTKSPITIHNTVITIVLLFRYRAHMCGYMFPQIIGKVPHLSSNQTLRQIQEYKHVLMWLGTRSPPYDPYDESVLLA